MERPNDYLSRLNRLPLFPGGRRGDMLPILADLRRLGAFENPEGKRLVDMTSGGGAASLVAKMLGYEVHSFDLGAKQTLLCQALLVETETLEPDATVTRLLRANSRSAFLQTHFAHNLLGPTSRILDRIAGNCESPTDWHLAATLLGNMRRADGDWPTLNFPDPNDPKIRAQQRLANYPEELLRNVIADLNGVRFQGRQSCFAYQEDSRQAIARLAPDVVLLDPPSLGVGDYELGYYLDECYLKQAMIRPTARMNESERRTYLESFLEATAGVPELCFWNPIDADSLHLEDWRELLQTHRQGLHERLVFHASHELICYSPWPH